MGKILTKKEIESLVIRNNELWHQGGVCAEKVKDTLQYLAHDIDRLEKRAFELVEELIKVKREREQEQERYWTPTFYRRDKDRVIVTPGTRRGPKTRRDEESHDWRKRLNPNVFDGGLSPRRKS